MVTRFSLPLRHGAAGTPGPSVNQMRLCWGGWVSLPCGVPDFRGVPTNACPACGGRVLTVQAMFDDYDIAAWFMDASCSACGALLTAPCPPDRPVPYWPSDDSGGVGSPDRLF